jgi:hypothetical protein
MRSRLALATGLWVAWTAAAAAQPATAAPRGGPGPIACWWAADRAAVRVGEPFGLTLTCRVLETARATVVPNLAEIEPGSIQLTPFEVVEGTRHQDVITPPWRYVQYSYRLRLLGEEFFGRDVPIPAAAVKFRVQTGGAEAVEGNEQTYLLPQIPVRILSLLPAQAADIRVPLDGSFADVEARRSRATVEVVAATILFAASVVVLLVAGVRGAERLRGRRPSAAPTAPAGAVLGCCLSEVERVRAAAARDGWTRELAAQAMAPLRIAGAMALSRPVAQEPARGDATPREGQIAVRHGWLGRRRMFVSAAVTGDAIDRLRAAGSGGRPSQAAPQVLDGIRDALARLNVVRYGRGGTESADVDRVLGEGSDALRRLHAAARWPARAAGAVRGMAWRR